MLKLKMILCSIFCLILHLNAGEDIFEGPTDIDWKAYDKVTINGPARLKLFKSMSLKVNGPVEFQSVNVYGEVEINGLLHGSKGKFEKLQMTGHLNVDHLTCHELTVKGPVTASYVVVHAHANLEGPVELRQSKIKTLTVKSDRIVLDTVHLDNIVVCKGLTNQTLILNGSSVVSGDIVFESGDGIVKVQGSEVQILGSIKGGRLQ